MVINVVIFRDLSEKQIDTHIPDFTMTYAHDIRTSMSPNNALHLCALVHDTRILDSGAPERRSGHDSFGARSRVASIVVSTDFGLDRARRPGSVLAT